MKLLIVVITHNRLEYTQETLKCLRDTTKVPYYLVIVDNASTDGTRQWLIHNFKSDMAIYNSKNLYPGAATNIGWNSGLKHYPEATHLMRLDNDMHLEPGWDTKVAEYFAKVKDPGYQLGQLGLDHEAIEGPEAQGKEFKINGMTLNPWPGCIGGPCVIPRIIWDLGIRYDETPWHYDGEDRPPMQEDSLFTWAIIKAGFLFGHMTERLSWTFATKDKWNTYPEYYRKTMKERGYEKQYPELFK